MNYKESRYKLIKRGFRGRCPICGKSPLFLSYIKLRKKCKNCDTDFSCYRTDDGQAYCTIFVVGHIIIPLIVYLESSSSPPSFEFQIIFWPLLTIIFSSWLLPKMKGAFLGFQISVKDRST